MIVVVVVTKSVNII